MVDLAREQELLRRRALGRGLAFPQIFPNVDLARDIQLVRGSAGLDFGQVAGMENLTQCLEVALTTLLDSDIFNTDFGFDGLNALVEETNPVLARERVRVAVIQVLRKDPRVRRIIDVKLTDGQLETPLPGSRDLHVQVAFETISGDQSSATLGKVVPNG